MAKIDVQVVGGRVTIGSSQYIVLKTCWEPEPYTRRVGCDEAGCFATGSHGCGWETRIVCKRCGCKFDLHFEMVI